MTLRKLVPLIVLGIVIAVVVMAVLVGNADNLRAISR